MTNGGIHHTGQREKKKVLKRKKDKAKKGSEQPKPYPTSAYRPGR